MAASNRCARWTEDGSPPVGNGDHSVAGVIEFAQPIEARGAHFLGAFEEDELASIVIVDPAFGPDTVWLALLHVDRSHRRSGVASVLWSGTCTAPSTTTGRSST